LPRRYSGTRGRGGLPSRPRVVDERGASGLAVVSAVAHHTAAGRHARSLCSGARCEIDEARARGTDIGGGGHDDGEDVKKDKEDHERLKLPYVAIIGETMRLSEGEGYAVKS